jgi:hypothetical protein
MLSDCTISARWDYGDNDPPGSPSNDPDDDFELTVDRCHKEMVGTGDNEDDDPLDET